MRDTVSFVHCALPKLGVVFREAADRYREWAPLGTLLAFPPSTNRRGAANVDESNRHTTGDHEDDADDDGDASSRRATSTLSEHAYSEPNSGIPIPPPTPWNRLQPSIYAIPYVRGVRVITSSLRVLKANVYPGSAIHARCNDWGAIIYVTTLSFAYVRICSKLDKACNNYLHLLRYSTYLW